MFGIVYGLENLLNQKIYIGQTHRTLEERFREHKCANSLIGRAIRKYGEENFVKVILEECENQEQLDACEIKWIARLNCMKPNGYNLTVGGNGTSGFKQTAEMRAKSSKAHKGKPLTDKHRQNISNSLKGRKFTDEHRKKLSVAEIGNKRALGRKTSDKTRALLSAAQTGKKLSAETRAKISAAKKAYYAKLKETK